MGQSAGSGNNTSQSQPFQAQPYLQPQPFQAQPYLQPQPFQAQPQPFQAQPQPFQAQPQPFQAQPQPFQAQPQNPVYNTRSPFMYQPQVPQSLQQLIEANRAYFGTRLGTRQPQTMYDQVEAQPVQAQPMPAIQTPLGAAVPRQPNPFFGGVTPRALPPGVMADDFGSTATRQPGNPGFPDPSTIFNRPARPARPFGEIFASSPFGPNFGNEP